MLSSINFLFLLALGFLSWTILCYIEQIEQLVYVNPNIPEQSPKRDTPETIEPMSRQGQTLSTPNRSNYDIYIYLICTLICMYALMKITHLAESYRRKKLPSVSHASNQTCSPVKSLDTQEDQSTPRKLKSNVLKTQILEPVDFEGKMGNIYIFNSFTQQNHDIDIDNRTIVNAEIGRETVHHANIWEKYMNLKELSVKKQHLGYSPASMSLEEFDNIKGIF